MYAVGCAAVSTALGHRIRWVAVAALVAAWFIALAADVAGNGVHLLLAGALAILVYELLVVETPT